MRTATETCINGRENATALPSLMNQTANPADWILYRRRELIAMFEELMFGRIPQRPEFVSYEIQRTVHGVFDGLGFRRDVLIRMRHSGIEHTVKALWYLPARYVKRHGVPVIVGLNFQGNAGCTTEEDVELEDGETRGIQAHRWQIPMLLKNGYSLIVAPRNQFFPDCADGRARSIFRLFHTPAKLTETHRELTAISAWAFGYSRLLELALTDSRIDTARIWAHGHSRLGKTALWTVANDPRFSGVVSSCAGCCGDSLFRNRLSNGETVKHITRTFPWWFQKIFDAFQDKEASLPLDMHFLAALAAPRPLLICSAAEDLWADPFNSFRCALYASEAYRLFGAGGLPADTVFPDPEHAVFGDRVGFSIRNGIHDVTETDWNFVLKFMERNTPWRKNPKMVSELEASASV